MRYISLTLALVFALCIAACSGGGSDPLPVDNSYYKYSDSTDEFEYEIYNDHAAIRSYIGSATDVTVPKELEGLPVTQILDQAFVQNHKLVSVTIPEGVTELKSAVFYDCQNLDTISIPRSVKKIGYSSFQNTAYLAQQKDEFVIVGDGVLIGYNGEDLSVNLPGGIKWLSDAFAISNIESIALNDGLKGIGGYAFFGCVYLQSVKLPNSLNYIGEYAFYQCETLENISIPSSVAEIDFQAFASTPFLTNKAGEFVVLGDGVLVAVPEDIASLTVPDNVRVIGEYSFSDKYSLESVTINDGVEFIDEYAFSGCTKLSSITLPSSLTRMGEGVFSTCVALKRVELPSSIGFLPKLTFDSCSGLEEIILPEGLSRVDAGAFADCSSLSSLELPKSLVFLGEEAFIGCSALSKLTIWSDVAFIGKSALYTQSGLTVKCVDGSYADGFCITNNIATEYITQS